MSRKQIRVEERHVNPIDNEGLVRYKVFFAREGPVFLLGPHRKRDRRVFDFDDDAVVVVADVVAMVVDDCSEKGGEFCAFLCFLVLGLLVRADHTLNITMNMTTLCPKGRNDGVKY